MIISSIFGAKNEWVGGWRIMEGVGIEDHGGGGDGGSWRGWGMEDHGEGVGYTASLTKCLK